MKTNYKKRILFIRSLLICTFWILGVPRVYSSEGAQKPVLSQSEIARYGSDEFLFSPDSIDRLLKEIKDSSFEKKDLTFLVIGIAYNQKGSYDSSFSFYSKGLHLAIDGHPSSEARYLTNFGINYMQLGQFDKSESNHKKALEIYSKLKDSVRVANVYNNLILLSISNQQYAEGLTYFYKSVEIKQKLNMSEARFNYANLARVYQGMNEYDSALKYFKKGLYYLESVDKFNSASIINYHLGNLYFKNKKYSLALKVYKRGLGQANQVNAKDHTRKLLSGISDCYFELGDLEKAFDFLRRKGVLSDSLNAVRNDRILAEKEFEYKQKVNEKNARINQAINQIALYQRNFIIYVAVSLILILLFVILRYTQKLKSAKVVQEQNKVIHEQNIKHIKNAEEIKTIKSFIEGQEKERYRIAKDLHDGIGGLLAGLKLNMEVSDYSQSERSKMAVEIDSIYQQVRFIAGNMAPPNFKTTKFSEILGNYLTEIKLTTQLTINLQVQSISEINQLNETVKIELFRILQELMTNIIKHAAAMKVDIQILNYDRWLNFILEDDGVGFDTAQITKGIGLSNIRSRVDALGGNIDIDSFEGRGSIFNIDVPI